MVCLDADLDEEAYYVESIKRVVNEIKSFELSNSINECSLSELDMDLKTVRDYVVCYASALDCITNHAKEIEFKNYYDLFAVDYFIVTLFSEKSVVFGETLKSTSPGICHSKNIEEIVMLAEKYFSEKKMKINCELDIESLIYKVYKNSENKYVSNENMELLLIILYLRNEFVRFFRIYKMISPSVLLYKLALIMTIREDSLEKRVCILKTDIKTLQVFSYIDYEKIKSLHNVQKIYDEIKGTDDIENWIKEKVLEYEWKQNVEVWARNRYDGTGCVDRSMLETCIKKMKFHEGWHLFLSGHESVRSDYHKAIYLCVRAIKNTDNKQIWSDRIIKIIDLALEKGNLDVCCVLVEDIFDSIENVDEKFRSIILREFLRKISKFETEEKIVNYVLRGINELCKKCINTETCEFCVQHANTVYEQWKKANTGGFFFKNHSQYEGEIFENILSVKNTISDCEGFYQICQDLADNRTKLSQEMFRMIRKVHDKTCKDCIFNQKNNIESKKSQSFLQHVCNKD